MKKFLFPLLLIIACQPAGKNKIEPIPAPTSTETAELGRQKMHILQYLEHHHRKESYELWKEPYYFPYIHAGYELDDSL